MKKMVSLVAVMCLLSLAGCGGGEDSVSLSAVESTLVGDWNCVTITAASGQILEAADLNVSAEFVLDADKSYSLTVYTPDTGTNTGSGRWSADSSNLYFGSNETYPYRLSATGVSVWFPSSSGGMWFDFVRVP